MNRNTFHALSTLAIATIVSTTFVDSSQARTTMASAGRAVFPADADCFRLDGSSVGNACSGIRGFETSLVIDAGGTYTVTVNAEGPTAASNVGCKAMAVDKTARFFSSSGDYQNLSGPPFLPQDIILRPVSVPFRGGLFVNCQLSPGGRVNTFNW